MTVLIQYSTNTVRYLFESPGYQLKGVSRSFSRLLQGFTTLPRAGADTLDMGAVGSSLMCSRVPQTFFLKEIAKALEVTQNEQNIHSLLIMTYTMYLYGTTCMNNA